MRGSDFVHNALIVPLKILRGHEIKDDLGVLDTQFHPTQPWIITAGADHTIRMYINIPCHVCLSHVEGPKGGICYLLHSDCHRYR